MSLKNYLQMENLIQKCWDDFQKVKFEPFVIPNSIPILWFGDLEAYSKSDLKIVTVGLNPSNVEFLPSAHSTSNYSVDYRFPLAKSLVNKSRLTGGDIQIYKDSINAYFTNTDKNGVRTWYKPWFGNYEAALNGLNASYITSHGNQRTAVHVDLWSPIATLKWGQLKSNQKSALQACASFSFKDLIISLKPHVIITCMNRDLIKSNYFDQNGIPCDATNAAFNYEKKSSNGRKIAYIRAYRLLDNRVLIWGNNGRTCPFEFQSQNGDIIPQIKLIRAAMQLP